MNAGEVPTDAPVNADTSSEENHLEVTAAGGTITYPRPDKKGGKIP